MGPLWLLLRLQLSVPLAARGPGQAAVWKRCKALTSEGKRDGTLSQAALDLQPSVSHSLWDGGQMSSPLQPQFPHLLRGSGSLHLAACENYNVGFSKLKTFAHSFHIYVLLLNFIEVKYTVECVKYTNVK